MSSILNVHEANKRIDELKKENDSLRQVVTQPSTVQTARTIQAEHDRTVAKSASLPTKPNKIESDIARAYSDPKTQTKDGITITPYVAPVPSYTGQVFNILSEGYWLMYAKGAAFIMVENMVIYVLKKRKPYNPNAFLGDDPYENLSKAEFDSVLQSKPSLDKIFSVYVNKSLNYAVLNDVNMDISQATPVW